LGGLGFGVSGLSFWILGSGFRVSSFIFRVQGLRFGVLSLGFSVGGFELRLSGSGYRAHGVWVYGIWFMVHCFGLRDQGFGRCRLWVIWV